MSSHQLDETEDGNARSDQPNGGLNFAQFVEARIIRPGDSVLINVTGQLDTAQLEAIRRSWNAMLPSVTAVLLHDGMQVAGIVRGEDDAHEGPGGGSGDPDGDRSGDPHPVEDAQRREPAQGHGARRGVTDG